MMTFPSTLVQGHPTPLITHKIIAITALEEKINPRGILTLQDEGSEKWKIGLREDLWDAIDRARRVSKIPIRKDTHVVFVIQFTPLGVAHYSKTYQGPDYRFQPFLQKKEYPGGRDWKVWHFHGDLPLQALDQQGNVLITTALQEIE